MSGLPAVRPGGTCVYNGSRLVSAVPIPGMKTPTRSGEMDDEHRDEKTREAVAERSNMGRFLAIGFVAIWLVTLLTLVGHAGVGGF